MWLQPIQAVLRRTTNEPLTYKHRNVMRTLVVEGWAQRRLCDIGWSDEKKCRGCDNEEGTEKHTLYHRPSRLEVRDQIPEGLVATSEKSRRKTGSGSEVSHRILWVASRWRKSHLSVSPTMGVGQAQNLGQGFGNRVATDGSVCGVSGRWSACGWSVVQLDHDEEMALWMPFLKRAELAPFLCLLGGIIGFHHGSCGQQKEPSLGFGRGLIWEARRRNVAGSGARQDTAPRRRSRTFLFSNGLCWKAMKGWKIGKLWSSVGGRRWPRSEPALLSRKERRFTRHCSAQLAFSVWRRHRTEWCAAAGGYHCMRCGRSSKKGKCDGPRWLEKDFNHKLNIREKTHLGEHDMVRSVDPSGEALIWCRKVFG